MVDDAATARLMAHFYRHRGASSNAQALRQAQLGLMGEYPHPYFWAAFTLTGK
jgi:CHAT domain-containing protein